MGGETPDGFRVLAERPALCDQSPRARRGRRFRRPVHHSGIIELGDKLGPLLWQFAPTKKFDDADFGAFWPAAAQARRPHAASRGRGPPRQFLRTGIIALLRKHQAPVVFADHDKYPEIADVTGDFVYARLQTG